jgi:hypothetical protein
LKFEWWQHAEYIFLMLIIEEVLKDNVDIEVSEL